MQRSLSIQAAVQTHSKPVYSMVRLGRNSPGGQITQVLFQKNLMEVAFLKPIPLGDYRWNNQWLGLRKCVGALSVAARIGFASARGVHASSWVLRRREPA